MLYINMSENNLEKPYQVGITLLCTGSIVNWLTRDLYYRYSLQYVGQACVAVGILCMCATIFQWYRATLKGYYNDIRPPSEAPEVDEFSQVTLHTVSMESMAQIVQKPPDYEVAEEPPPNYEEAVKLQILTSKRTDPVAVHIRCLNDENKTPPPPYKSCVTE